MTATSASSHRQYLTGFGYSVLHSSDKCFPADKFNRPETGYSLENCRVDFSTLIVNENHVEN